MKISHKIEQAAKEDRVWWSFEYFPPRTAQVSRFWLRAAAAFPICDDLTRP